MRTSEKNKGLLGVKKEKNLVKSLKGRFFKIAETAHCASSTEAAYSEHSIYSYSFNFNCGYVTPVPAFVCSKLTGREASSFCDFLRWTCCDLTTVFSFFTQTNFVFLDVLNWDNYS